MLGNTQVNSPEYDLPGKYKMIRYIVLITLWVAWCFLHSFLITPVVTRFIQKHLRKTYQYYRIIYNFIALVSLIPVMIYSFSIKGVPVFYWEGPFRIIQGTLIFSALLFFIGGARQYDIASFIGVRQIRENSTCSILNDDCRLNTTGMLGIVRHPWYSGGILIVWARNLDMSAILTSLVISGYFLIGAYLEERRLLSEFGDQYFDYQQHVSMLFPLKWLRQKSLNWQNKVKK
jgi:protein-S-isoprenylcysteine O-methyltransferase Ste14